MADAYTKSPSDADNSPVVSLAKITSVNPRASTVSVITVATHKDLTDIPIAVPYGSPATGGGVLFMPEVGAHCYLFECADDTRFIMGFVQEPTAVATEVQGEDGSYIPAPDDDAGPNFRGGARSQEPGDINLYTKDGNCVRVLRGGIVEISTPSKMCGTTYLPVQNLIRTLFGKYIARSPIGELEWDHAELVRTKDGVEGNTTDTPCIVRFSSKQHTQEDVSAGRYSVELRVGSVSEDMLDMEVDSEHIFASSSVRDVDNPFGMASGPGVLSLVLYDHEGESVSGALQFSPAGDGFFQFKRHLHVEVGDTAFLSVGTRARVGFGTSSLTLDALSNLIEARVSSVLITALSNLKVVAGSAIIEVGGVSLSIGADGVIVGGGLQVGQGSARVVVDRGLLEALLSHTHMAPSGLTGVSAELAAANILTCAAQNLTAD